MSDAIGQFAKAQYLSLETFRKSASAFARPCGSLEIRRRLRPAV